MVMTAVAGAYSANSQRQAGRANAAIANQNAATATAEQQSSYEGGAARQVQYGDKLKQLQGRALAAAGAGGVDPTKGSPLDVMVQSEKFGQEDIQTIRQNAALTAFGFGAQAINFRNQGALDSFEGGQQAIGTLLTTGAQAYGTYVRGTT